MIQLTLGKTETNLDAYKFPSQKELLQFLLADSLVLIVL